MLLNTCQGGELGPEGAAPQPPPGISTPGHPRPGDPAGRTATCQPQVCANGDPALVAGVGVCVFQMTPHYSSVNIKHHCLTNEEKPLPSE